MIEKNAVLKEFFIKEFDTLQMKTGIRQLENMADKKTFKEDITLLIGFMIEECNRPPFDLVGVDVKMKVIRAAIVDDKDFIGMNAKFVRRALGTWWQFNKDLYFDKLNHGPTEPQPEPAPPEVREKYIQEWFKELDAVGNNSSGVPKLSAAEIRKEGREQERSLSGSLNKLAPKMDYQSTSDERFVVKQRIREVCAKVYANLNPNVKPKGLAVYTVDGYEIFCESQQKAQEIYIEATSL